MYASTRRYKLKAGSKDVVSERVQKGLIPLLSRQPGFIAYYAMDCGSDVAMAFSVYTDSTAAEAANKAAAQWVNQNLVGLLGAPEVTVGEVMASSAQPS